MKVSHEVPRCLLTASPSLMIMIIVYLTLLDQDEEYKQYFIMLEIRYGMLLWIIHFMN